MHREDSSPVVIINDLMAKQNRRLQVQASLKGHLQSEICQKRSEDTLPELFNEYLAPSEEPVVRKAFQRTDDKSNLDDTADEELFDLLERFECRKIPTKENIMSLILEVAHKEIIQKPQYIADCWDGVFKEALTKGNLSTLEGICSVYQCFMLLQKLMQSARHWITLNVS